MNAKVLAARIGLRHHIDMVGASQRLTGVCDLLEQAPQAIDACEDKNLSVLIDTALQEAKIAAANTDD